MEQYVDGYLIPVPADRLDDYRELARKAGAIWREHGALAFWECVGDDLDAPGMVSFRAAAAAGPDEVVMFSWIVFASRADRDRINAAVMADPRIQAMPPEDMPFDCQRMAFGGFIPIVVG
ncbi:MAG: DUF1428 domain-containing protein [Rhodocyclaceae bacterium]|nr:DUF1428 domain-containing protein [Rhodocyclaceae bacterium]